MTDTTTFPDRLAEGYRSFLGGRFVREQERYAAQAEGQTPEIMVVSCVDSRVSPEVIFDAAPGELLVLRNVANLVPKYEPGGDSQHGTSAALEFAVQALRVKHIVVLGHARCGGIKAFADDVKPLSSSDFIGHWMGQIEPAAEALEGREGKNSRDYLRKLEFASVRLSLKNLMTFPWIDTMVHRGELHLHGAYFGVATGKLMVLNQATNEFASVVDGSSPLASIICEGIED